MASVHKGHNAVNTALKEKVSVLKAALLHTIHRLADKKNRQEQYDATMRNLSHAVGPMTQSIRDHRGSSYVDSP